MPLFRILTAILLAGFLPGVRAYCWIDSNDVERCDGLSAAARSAIGLGFFLLFLGLIFGTIFYRRRRNAQANLAYTRQTMGGNQFGYGGGPGPFVPQYPPQTYNGSPYAYDPSTGFASVGRWDRLFVSLLTTRLSY
ncbi:hypothetical protein BJV78DRAFT_1285606 [Lactifluus subvellereus]|nr:hypothetical protein BJV78DRAFT_1285606 [Lactifluus subvellereus]